MLQHVHHEGHLRHVQRPRSHYGTRSDDELGLLSTVTHHTVHRNETRVIENARLSVTPACGRHYHPCQSYTSRSLCVVILITGYPVFIKPQIHTVVKDNIVIVKKKTKRGLFIASCSTTCSELSLVPKIRQLYRTKFARSSS